MVEDCTFSCCDCNSKLFFNAVVIASSTEMLFVVGDCALAALKESKAKTKMLAVEILIFLLDENRTYNNGKTNRVKKVAVSKPPITTVANGFCTSAPAPCESAIGKNPNDATVAVINTGRKRILVPSFMRWIMSVIPSFSNWLKVPISTIPFKTATPNNAIKPIPAEMLKGISRMSKANTPPIALIGMAV